MCVLVLLAGGLRPFDFRGFRGIVGGWFSRLLYVRPRNTSFFVQSCLDKSSNLIREPVNVVVAFEARLKPASRLTSPQVPNFMSEEQRLSRGNY
jgi:hypothetical protein